MKEMGEDDRIFTPVRVLNPDGGEKNNPEN